MSAAAFDFYIDFKCPASYLAVKPTLDLMERTGAAANWFPFRSKQQSIPAQHSEETVGERHRRVRAIQRRETHLRYAGVQGIDMRFRDDAGSSDAALAALLEVEGDPLPFVRAAFAAYWAEGADLDDPQAVSAPAQEHGLKVKPGSLRACTAEIDRWQTRIEERGIFFTPTYVVDEDLFVGREHLPWIEELLRSATQQAHSKGR